MAGYRKQNCHCFPKREKDKHLGLRIDSELHYKLHYISQYEGRSANGEVIYLICKAIEDFEKQHGKIETSKKRHVRNGHGSLPPDQQVHAHIK